MQDDSSNINDPENRQKPMPKASNTLKVVVLLILLVLLVIGIILPIKLIPDGFNSLSRLVSSWFTQDDSVTLSIDKTPAMSGAPFTLSWTGNHRTDGSYVFSYTCTDDVKFVAAVAAPDEIIPCATPYYFTATDNSIVLTASTIRNRFIDAPITLGFLKNGATTTEALGDMSISISNPSGANIVATSTSQTATSTTIVVQVPQQTQPATSTTSQNTSSSPSYPSNQNQGSTPGATSVTSAHRVSNPTGSSDLQIQILSTGLLNNNGSYVQTSSIPAGSRAAVRFSVKNIGDKASTLWSFSAVLPSASRSSYNASNLRALGPDDSIVFTLGFDNVLAGTNQFSITISGDDVSGNNTAQTSITTFGQNPSGTPSYNPGTNTGKADLAITILSTGTINTYNNQYAQTSSINSNDRAAIQFQVQNIGGTVSGQWQFTASLPSSSNPNYTSDYQNSLAPGQKVTITIGFDNIQNQGSNNASIQVDPNNRVDESTDSNNYASVTLYRN